MATIKDVAWLAGAMTASASDSNRYFVSGMKQLAPLSTMKSASSATLGQEVEFRVGEVTSVKLV